MVSKSCKIYTIKISENSSKKNKFENLMRELFQGLDEKKNKFDYNYLFKQTMYNEEVKSNQILFKEFKKYLDIDFRDIIFGLRSNQDFKRGKIPFEWKRESDKHVIKAIFHRCTGDVDFGDMLEMVCKYTDSSILKTENVDECDI